MVRNQVQIPPQNVQSICYALNLSLTWEDFFIAKQVKRRDNYIFELELWNFVYM